MHNPFGKKNKQLKQLEALSASFAILTEFQRRGLLHFHSEKGKVSNSSSEKASNGSLVGYLLIEQSLAIVQLAQGAEKFRDFLDKVCQWQNFNLLQLAYDAHRIDTEAKAVREAKKQYALLTKADIQRIRQNARDNMEELDPDKLNYIKEFDLFIIKANAPSASETIKSVSGDASPESNGQLVALGHYDGKHLEMALYDDIKHNLG